MSEDKKEDTKVAETKPENSESSETGKSIENSEHVQWTKVAWSVTCTFHKNRIHENP